LPMTEIGERGQVMWEREAVHREVALLLEAAAAGRGGALFVVGGSGLGKTSVLDEAMVSAAQAMDVGTGRGDLWEMALPMGVLDQALGEVGAPVLSVPGREPDAYSGCYRVLRWLGDVRRPVLIALDDLHWADPDSLAVLSFLCRRIRARPVAVIATMRPWPEQAVEMARALAAAGARVETLDPLSQAASGQLLAELLGRPIPDGVSKRAWEDCAGNPLLLHQLAAAIERGEVSADGDQEWPRLDSRGLLLTRFAGLPPAALRYARAASVLGVHSRFDLAAEVAGLEDAELDLALEALSRSGLVVQEAAGYIGFVHALFAQALYDDLPEPVRARLHARCFAVLSRHGLDAEAAGQAMQAGLSGDLEVVATIERAGRAALRTGAFATAASQLGNAARLAGDRVTASLLAAQGGALLGSGDPAGAVLAFERALARGGLTPAARGEALRGLGRSLYARGEHELATARFQQAATALQRDDPRLAAEVLLDQALTLRIVGGPAMCLPLATRARELAAGADDALRTRAAATCGFLEVMAGNPGDAAAIAAAARSAEADPLPKLADQAWTWGIFAVHGHAAKYLEDFPAATPAFRQAQFAAGQLGAAEGLAMSLIGEAEVAARTGRLAEALALAERAEELVEAVPIGETYLAVVRAWAFMHLDRMPEAEEACKRLEALLAGRIEAIARAWLVHLRATSHLAAGRPDEAARLYLEAEELSQRMGVGEPCVVPWAGHAVVAHARSGRRTDADRVLAWLESGAGRLPCRWPRIAVALGRAALAEADGDQEGAGSGYRSALSLHDQVGLPLDRAATLVAYGAFLRHAGLLGQARSVLGEAASSAEAIGAAWIARQAREELAVAGGRPKRARPGLSPQELRVAKLVKEGLSRREIARRLTLSEGTVRSHLEHIYRKLGVHSARELMLMSLDDGVG